MSFDLQMARGHSGEWHNLAIGEPFFLQETVTRCPVSIADLSNPHVGYPEVGGDPILLSLLKEDYSEYGRYVVVTNGAKQALLAAYYALRKTDLAGHTEPYVYHPAPYWPSHPTLAKQMALLFTSDTKLESKSIVTVTAPNNPDGSEASWIEKVDVWDAAYAHPVYGFDPCEAPHQPLISVWSAAKLYGLSGARVGWLVTNNKAIADEASYYVEITTSGVSTLSQRRVAATIKALRADPLQAERRYAQARETLSANVIQFCKRIYPHCDAVAGAPNGKGMYAFFKVLDPEKFEAARQKAKVMLVTGEACGMTEQGWYRMNMGHRRGYTANALDALEAALRE